MEQIPSWESINRFSASQEIFRNLYKSSSLVRILRKMDPIHALPSFFFQSHFDFFPPTPRSSKRFLSFRFPNLNLELSFVLDIAYHTPSSHHHSWFRHFNNILRGLHLMKLLITRFSRTSCDYLLCWTFLRGSMFLNFLSLCPYVNG